MFIKISDSEKEVMEVIWEKNDFISIYDVHTTLSENKEWAYRTVATFMTRLAEKGYLKIKKQDKVNLYIPTVTKDEYIKEQTRDFLKLIHNGNKRSLIAALYDENISNEKIDELLKTLEG